MIWTLTPSPSNNRQSPCDMNDLALPSPEHVSGAGDACLFGLSLCSGAGGLDLGLTIAIPGYRAVGYVERETYAAAILVARMEDAALDQAPVWDNIISFDGRPWRGAVDIVTAGYPCQPFSVAGRRRGGDDPRHLWPQIARIVSEAQPPFVFLENVAHHLRLGFSEVAEGLVGMGYKLAAGLFTAAEVGAPHKRERLFILAIREEDELADPTRLLWDPLKRRQQNGDVAAVEATGCECGRRPPEQIHALTRRVSTRDGSCDIGGVWANKASRPRQKAKCGKPPNSRSASIGDVDDTDGTRSQGRGNVLCEHTGEQPPWPPGPGDTDGWVQYLRAAPNLEPAVRRCTDWLAYRVDRLRLCGNGVVPLVAAHALRTLAAELLADR